MALDDGEKEVGKLGMLMRHGFVQKTWKVQKLQKTRLVGKHDGEGACAPETRGFGYGLQHLNQGVGDGHQQFNAFVAAIDCGQFKSLGVIGSGAGNGTEEADTVGIPPAGGAVESLGVFGLGVGHWNEKLNAFGMAIIGC